VLLLLVFAVLAVFLAASNGYKTLTGGQALDLPAPPAPPGMEETLAPIPNVTITPVSTLNITIPAPVVPNISTAPIERPIAVPEPSIQVPSDIEQRLADIEAKASAASSAASRLDAMQSQIDGLKVDVTNLQQRPSVEAPFFDSLNAAKRNTVLSISLSVLALIIVASLVGYGILQKKKAEDDDKRKLRQYLLNYQKAGYQLDALKEHLSASGWNEQLIDEVISEMPK